MPFLLIDFTRHIDPVICDRGLHCFSDDAVREFQTDDPSRKRASVMGSRAYQVDFEMDGDTLISHHCECPYDGGPYCKHVAAFIFHLLRERLDIKPLRP